MNIHVADNNHSSRLENGRWIIGIVFFCLSRLAVLEYWLIVRLENFYCHGGDDVSRISQALLWSKHVDFRPMADWLPLPYYLIGIILKFFPHPQSAGSHLHALLSTITLGAIGLMTLRLFPKNPAASLIALLGVQFIPEFQSMSLSSSAEVEMWLFLTLAVYFWTLYLDRGEIRYAWLNAVSLGLASMTRYEAWLFLGLFSILAMPAFRRHRESSRTHFGYLSILFAYAIFFVLYQESSLGSFRAHPDMLAQVLPLSYRGIRLSFHAPLASYVDVVRSYRLPLIMFLSQYPAMSLLGLFGAARVIYAREASSWLALLWIAALVLFCFVSGFFGASLNTPRLIILFYLLIAPFFGQACAALIPDAAKSLPLATLAALAGLGYLPRMLPAPMTVTPAEISPATAIFGKAIYLVDRNHHDNSKILFELYESGPESYAESSLQFAAFDRVLLDRRKLMPVTTRILITENNPSIFQSARPELQRYLDDARIGLLIAHSDLATKKLRGLAAPIASLGGVALYGYRLSPEAIDAYRKHIDGIRAKVDPND